MNPGPFTVKEHVLVTIMGTVGAVSAYATDIVAVQRVYYQQQNNFSYQWFIVMSTQMIGFSIGGVAKRFLVQPPSMSEIKVFKFQILDLICTLDSMAFQSRFMCFIQHVTFSAICRYGYTRRHQQGEIFHLRLSWRRILVFRPGVPFPSAFSLLMGLLDQAK